MRDHIYYRWSFSERGTLKSCSSNHHISITGFATAPRPSSLPTPLLLSSLCLNCRSNLVALFILFVHALTKPGLGIQILKLDIPIPTTLGLDNIMHADTNRTDATAAQIAHWDMADLIYQRDRKRLLMKLLFEAGADELQLMHQRIRSCPRTQHLRRGFQPTASQYS